jgi:hypothetical protein
MELLIALAAAITLNVPGRADATPIAATGDFVVITRRAAAACLADRAARSRPARARRVDQQGRKGKPSAAATGTAAGERPRFTRAIISGAEARRLSDGRGGF